MSCARAAPRGDFDRARVGGPQQKACFPQGPKNCRNPGKEEAGGSGGRVEEKALGASRE